MRKLIKILILLFCFCNYVDGKSNDDIYFYHLTPRDGLSQMNILSIYQDELGVVWFGTTEGIDRYNGQSVEYFQPSTNEELRDNTIYSITGNKAGLIYAIAGKNLIKFNIHNYKFELLNTQIDAMTYANGLLWIAKKDSIIQYDETKNQFNLYAKLNKDVSTVLSICPTKTNGLWLGTANGLVNIDYNNLGQQHIVKENTTISRIYADSKNNLWAASKSEGVFKIDPLGNIQNYRSSIEKNSISNDQVRDIIEDNAGNIWVATFYGLNKLDHKNLVWYQYLHDDNRLYSLSHSSIFSLYKDVQGTIWIGTYFGGVNYFNQDADVFRYYEAKISNLNYLSFPYVGNMVEDKYGNLWICTEGGALNCMNLATRQLSRYPLSNNLKSVNQKCIWYDKDHDLLYIGLYNEGLAIFNIKTKQIKLLGNTNDSNSLLNQSNKTINHMEFYKGRLIMMTPKGLISMDTDKEQFFPFSENPEIKEALTKAKSLTFHIDKNDRLWLISNGLMCIDLKTGKVKEYLYEKDNKHSISKSEINFIFETSAGDIYFSSLGSGIFKYNPSSDDFDSYTEQKNGLISDFCYSISETPSGSLILLHNKGLSFFDPKNPKMNIFRSSLNFPILGFNTGNNVYITSNNEIFIGGINGLISFDENNINKVDKDYQLYFDVLYINNKKVSPGDDTDVLSEALPFINKIVLKSDQTNFKVEFATNSYLQTMVHNYEYKLEGFDKNWIQTNNRLISYTNLNPGNYTLLVQEVGNPQKRCVLQIEIVPPFYKSTIALISYGILIILLAYGVLKFYLWRGKLRTSLEFEHKEKQRIEELNQVKLRFFTNISHEFRTPLTLINGHVESLLIQSDINSTTRSKIDKIYKNTNHLQSLITELLDFRKQEQGYYKLKVKSVEFIDYIKTIYDSFREYAILRNIKYKLEVPEEKIYLYIDPSYFRKAVYNLLSNAFKYTANGGEIKVQIKRQGNDQILINIVDNGIGIAPEHLTKIFERFFQLEYRSSQLSLGTGIGLAFTKEIINSHKGSINVTSTPNEGSVFSISLKLGKQHFTEEELVSENSTNPILQNEDLYKIIEKDEHYYENESIDDLERLTVLIVDDNAEIIELLTNALSRFYNVYTAQNGRDAFDIIERELPDLVISDVVMPEISGKELCTKIKNNVNTSHIPVILLTAQGDEEQIIRGYMFGADLYVTKPFNMKILLSQCNNLIRNRQLLYKRITNRKVPDSDFHAIAEDDQKLIDRAVKIIKDSLADAEFDMNKLAAELGLGRSKLYTKIKDITGMTPNELTLNIKLKEAVHLLEHDQQKNISEIAFSLGFSTTKYFSKCFKTFYGITPQNWRKRDQNNENTPD